MRHLGYALVVVVCWCAVALGKPKEATPAQRDELAKLDKEYTEQTVKQAYFAAAKVAKKLYELQIKATGATSLQARVRKQTLAGALSVAGDAIGAEKLYREIAKDVEAEKGADSRDELYALMSLNGALWAQGRYDDIDALQQRMMAITKKLDGENSQSYAQQLTQYGGLLQLRNEFSAAVRTYEQALQIYESIAPAKDDASLINPIQTLASAYWYSNQQPKAIVLYDRAIAISQSAKNVMPMIKTSTIWSAATTYFYGGRKDLALALFKKAIDLTEKEIEKAEKANPDDYVIPGMLTQLGYMYKTSGNLPKAEATFEKAIAIAARKKTFSGMEMALADIRREQGKNKEALALLEKAAAELAKVSPQSATSYNQVMADVLKDLGDYKRAEKLLDDHRAYIVKQWGKRSMFYGMLQMSAVHVYAAAGKMKEAEKALDESLDIAERELANVMRQGTDADHAVYFTRYAYVLDTTLNFHFNNAPNSGAVARLALTTLMRRKGRMLDAAAAALATIRSKLSPDDKKLLDEMNSARTQLAKLTVAGPTAVGDADEYAKEVAALEDKIQRLEMQVAKKSAAYRTVTQPIELATVQKMIPSDARLVEIISYQPYDQRATYAVRLAGSTKPRRYAAYIVGAKGDPTWVDLGETVAIDAVVEAFRKALADPDNDRVAELGRSLFDTTMAKIVPKLGGSTNILIAPDGSLNVVPFSALVDDKQEFLIKKYTFTYLTSGRDLMRLAVKTKAKGGGVMFADPQFDSTGPAQGAGKTRGQRSVDLASLHWPQLPGTAAEAEAVTKTFKGFTLYRGDQATEGNLKIVKAPKVLHLATHGFFLPDEPPPPPGDEANRAVGPAAGAAGPPTELLENPLLRSGLALAGANKLQSGDDDGVLTALEASGLDLWGTKLVVLSACETGVGKVSNGDGVYGLRRALVIAGAESLVMSVWQVDDFATKELMAGFYKRLAKGKGRSIALREIQLELLAKPKYAHPFYWAAFLPAGATTPLKD